MKALFFSIMGRRSVFTACSVLAALTGSYALHWGLKAIIALTLGFALGGYWLSKSGYDPNLKRYRSEFGFVVLAPMILAFVAAGGFHGLGLLATALGLFLLLEQGRKFLASKDELMPITALGGILGFVFAAGVGDNLMSAAAAVFIVAIVTLLFVARSWHVPVLTEIILTITLIADYKSLIATVAFAAASVAYLGWQYFYRRPDPISASVPVT